MPSTLASYHAQYMGMSSFSERNVKRIACIINKGNHSIVKMCTCLPSLYFTAGDHGSSPKAAGRCVDYRNGQSVDRALGSFCDCDDEGLWLGESIGAYQSFTWFTFHAFNLKSISDLIFFAGDRRGQGFWFSHGATLAKVSYNVADYLLCWSFQKTRMFLVVFCSKMSSFKCPLEG